MVSFYSFCRIVDDIADDSSLSNDKKYSYLNAWKKCVSNQQASLDGLLREEETSTGSEIRNIIEKYAISRELFLDIINGVEQDINHTTFDTYKQLEDYCYLVASVVGLISIEIMGYKNESCKEYAVNLGKYLQTINIMRDIAEDNRQHKRVYIPLEDLKKYNYSLEELHEEKYNKNFINLMEYYYAKAINYRGIAEKFLSEQDKKAMKSSEFMSSIYSTILNKMRSDQYRIFSKRYSLTKVEKLLALTDQLQLI